MKRSSNFGLFPVPCRPMAVCMAAGLALAPVAVAWADDRTPSAMEAAALEPIASETFDALQAQADLDLAAFDSVYVAEPDVSFRPNWRRNQSRSLRWRLRDEDVERIQSDVSSLVREVFQQEFTEAGYALAEAPGEGVLVVQPDIIDLDVVAPDIQFPGRYFQYSEYAGEMTLDLKVRDGANETVLLTIEDRKRDLRQGFFEWRTRVNNLAQARIWTRSWARDVRETMELQG